MGRKEVDEIIAKAAEKGKRADLGGAYLRGADLRGVDLGKDENGDKCKLLKGNPVLELTFSHGWPLQLFHTDKGIRVVCGCRGPWTVKKARAHWKKHEQDQRRQVVLPALEALLKVAKVQGWVEQANKKEKAA